MSRAAAPQPGVLISVVVPVHNAAAFLPVCLGSIAAQSHRNLECILVEDGSTDDSAAVCRAFAARDSRFSVLSQAQCGVSAARAAGAAAAKGEYLAFADADDLYHRDLLHTLLAAAQASGLPIAACRYDTFTDAPVPDAPAPPPGEYTALAAPAHLKALLHDQRVDFGLWNKLYRRSLMSPSILANGYRFNEDLLANWQAFLAAPGIAYCDFAGYHYRQHAASASHRPLSAESIAQQRAVAETIRDTAPDAIKPSADAFYYEKLAYLASMILRRADAAGYARPLAELRAALADGLNDPRYGKNPALPRAIRLAAAATVRCPGLYGRLCRLLLKDRQ